MCYSVLTGVVYWALCVFCVFYCCLFYLSRLSVVCVLSVYWTAFVRNKLYISNQLVFLVRFASNFTIVFIFIMCLSNNSGIDSSQSLPHASKVLINGFAPNSQWRRVWSLARMSLDVKVKGQWSRSPGTKTHLAFPSPTGSIRMVMRLLQTECSSSGRQHSVPAAGDFGGLRAVHVW